MTKKKLEEEIDNIVKQLVKKVKPQKIILFGSAAWGESSPHSDLDFLVVKDKVPKYGYQRMQYVRDNIRTDLPVDFLVYKPEEFNYLVDKREPFTKKIVDQGKVLYG